MQIPSWVNISDDNYNSLKQNVVANLDNKNCRTTVNNQMYALNEAKVCLLRITTENIRKKWSARTVQQFDKTTRWCVEEIRVRVEILDQTF